MFIALSSYSKDERITRVVLDEIGHALEYQLHAHYAPLWQADGVQVRVYTSPSSIGDSGEACPLLVFDDADQAGALGYHTVDPYGRAFGRAFWSVLQGYGATLMKGSLSLSVTLSHEALEMVGNPYVNFWADVDAPGVQEALELCDRVQADSYEVGGVAVSNFLGPRAFRMGPGPYDHMRKLTSPFEIRPGGYAIRRSGASIFEVFGEDFPDWKRALLDNETSRSQKRARVLEQCQNP